MNNLLGAVKNAVQGKGDKPFSVFTSIKEQKLLNVPVAKPLLVVVLSGNKALGVGREIMCQPGEFIFLSSSPAVDMRNIPKDNEYLALLIEFDYCDFDGIQINTSHQREYCIGEMTPTLEQCLQQFIESSQWAPKELWSIRKREIISLLCHQGHRDILSLLTGPKIKDQLHGMFVQGDFTELSIVEICEQLAMSESTLRRKLKIEGTSVQEIKDQARLGLALNLLQTTRYSIAIVAEKCGYQSQSRFTERFKVGFGLTPTALRKTKMTD